MISALLRLMLFAMCITSWNKVMSFHQIPLVIIPEEVHNANSCPPVDFQNEGLQLIRNNVISTIANYSYYDIISKHCGEGLWDCIVSLNMSDPSQQCPSNWKEYNDSTNGIRACGRFDIGCPGVFYPVGHRYSKVCGRIIGYQVASPGAFHIYLPPENINDIYVDGISVTYGSPRTHIWTFAAGVTEGTHDYPQADCPCAVSDPSLRRPAPDFVGDDYYCESGNPNPTGAWIGGHLYSQDPLWDGEQCEGQCCSNGKCPPRFSVELASPTAEDIEVRICGDQNLFDEDNPITLLELFVQ